MGRNSVIGICLTRFTEYDLECDICHCCETVYTGKVIKKRGKMMYDELLGRLHKRIALTTASSPLQDDLEEAADAIETMREMVATAHGELANVIQSYEESKPRWIPVTERLPESKKKTYWVCTDTGYQCECRWTNNMYGLGISDSWGWSIMDVPQYQKVVAWRDLPESYEPQKEEMK